MTEIDMDEGTPMSKTRFVLILIGVSLAGGSVFALSSYFGWFTPQGDVWLTDHFAISAQAQPLIYWLVVSTSLFIILASVYLGLFLTWFLLLKGSLFLVGSLILVAAGMGLFALALFGEPHADDSELSHLLGFSFLAVLMLAVGIPMLRMSLTARREAKQQRKKK